MEKPNDPPNRTSVPGVAAKISPRTSAWLGLLLLVPIPSVGILCGANVFPGPVGQTIYGISKLWILVLPAVWYRWVDGGLWSFGKPIGRGLVTGLISGSVISIIIFGGYWFIGRRLIDVNLFRKTLSANRLDEPAVYIGLATYLCLVNSLLEEYVWRWFVFRKCEALFQRPVAVIAAALFFTIHHVLALNGFMPWHVTLLGSLGVFTGGLIWSWLYLQFRSVWPGYFSHLVVDITIFVIGWLILF